MKVNGLEFSSEKTNRIIFNNGFGPKDLNQIVKWSKLTINLR